jgi:hypothetical protein
VLRDYINATIGFTALATATGTPAKSLMRMFGPHGNPTAANLSGVISALPEKTGVHLEVGRRRPDALVMYQRTAKEYRVRARGGLRVLEREGNRPRP